MKKKFATSFLISFLCFALVFFAFGEKLFVAMGSSEVSNEDYDENDDNVGKKNDKNEILFLMMGVDANGVKNYKGIRTDTMMLFKVNFNEGSIDVLSIPRDTRVAIKGKLDKVNHAHSFGGTDLTMQTLKDFLNIDLDYYVKVDYKAVMAIVDAIGGVEIDVPQRMKYSDPYANPPLKIDLQPGLQVLDGKNAHDFLRFRKGYAEGDMGRINAQQMFLKELIKQTLTPKNILKLPALIETYFDYVETNIPLKMMTKAALSANKIKMESMTTTTIPGEPQRIKGIDYWIADDEALKLILNEKFADYLLTQ